jgi:hypothetical protein
MATQNSIGNRTGSLVCDTNLTITDGKLTLQAVDCTVGQIVVGQTNGKPKWATLSVSGAITKTEGEGTLGLTVSAGALPFVVATADLTATPNTCYSIQHATPANKLLVSLPAVASSTAGDIIQIIGYTAGGWKVVQTDVAHQIIMGNQSSTLGVAGYIEFTQQYDAVTLRCIDGNVWQVDRGPQGNITVA